MKKLFALLLVALPLAAAEPNADIHNALRALRVRALEAANKGDIDGVLAQMHPNVVVTWHNAEVSHGREAVRKYLERQLKGPNPIVKSYHADFEVDELTQLHGPTTGIAWGSSTETYDLGRGERFTLHGRWSGTIVNENGQWLLASLHTSSNLFDNPLLHSAKRAIWIAAAIAAVAALLIGWLLGRRRR
jgi:ketosteroid isomerase-like protein